MAGELTIKSVEYDLKAQTVNVNKERFYTKSITLNGTTILNESGNTAKKRWSYAGQTTKTILDTLETALDAGLSGGFIDHTGTTYTTCIFELTRREVTGNYTIENWSMLVTEV